MYFVTYIQGHGAWGNIDIQYEYPIVDRDDINALTERIADILNCDTSEITIINWRYYDDPE